MGMDLKTFGEELAKIGLPLLGAALPIPGGAALGTALASAIGSPTDKPEDVLATLGQSADAIEKAKEFQAQNSMQVLQIHLDYQKSMYAEEVADRQSARTLQQVTQSLTVPMLAWAIIGTFIAVVGATLLGYSHVESALAGTLVGYVSAKAEQIIGFYFGSSHGSQNKDILLANSQPASTVVDKSKN
jgi:hypothetical protein